ncbi:MAG: hypothetical protein QXL94_01855 [Candidatus Parvarchaeum sp.]
MNYKLHGKQTAILMSLRTNTPYADYVEAKGKTKRTNNIKEENTKEAQKDDLIDSKKPFQWSVYVYENWRIRPY